MIGDDYKIVNDETKDGVRHITAIPSKIVCSTRIDFDIIDNKLRNLVYTRGCDGSLKAMGRLLEGMPLQHIVSTLYGVHCHDKGTSCSDQLARIIKSLQL